MLDLDSDPSTGPVGDGQVIEPVTRESFGIDRDGFGGAEHEVDESDAGDEVLVRVAVVRRPQIHSRPPDGRDPEASMSNAPDALAYTGM